MDFSSLFSSSVPSYFVLGPLILLILGLVVAAARKASPSIPAVVVAQAVSPVAQASVIPISNFTPTPIVEVPLQQVPVQVFPVAITPVVESPPQVVPEVHVPPSEQETPVVSMPMPPSPEPVVVPVQEVQAVIPEPVVIPQDPSALTPVPEPVSIPQVVSSVPTGVIPPISSWKPAEPVVVPVDATHSEAQMQAEASASAQTQ